MASWAVRLPSIKAGLHLGPGALGIALVGQPLGLVPAVQLVPGLVRRFSSATVARWSMVGAALVILGPALAWNAASLAASLVLLGVLFGVSDITVNVQAVGVEQAYRRPLMSGLHAMWSLGLLGGSLAASVAAAAGVSPRAQLLVMGVALALAVVGGGTGLLSEEAEELARPSREAQGGGARWRFLQQTALVLTALIAFCSLLVEGSVSDWSSVYLHGTQHASLGTAALGVAVYSVGATIGRLAGNGIIARVGRTATLWRTALVAALGMAVAVIAPNAVVALLGYGLLGLGVAMIVPIAFSIAGSIDGPPAAWALARVTMFGYAGSFVGPAVIGLVAQNSGLGAALAIPAVLLVFVVPLTIVLRRHLPAARS